MGSGENTSQTAGDIDPGGDQAVDANGRENPGHFAGFVGIRARRQDEIGINLGGANKACGVFAGSSLACLCTPFSTRYVATLSE